MLLGSPNSDYDYDDSSSSGLSAGAIAGITIAGVLLFFIIGTFLMIGLIYMRHRYNQQSQSCNVTQQTVEHVVCNPTCTLPNKCFTNFPAADNCAFVGTPDEFSGYPPPSAPPQYYAGPQPAAPQYGYIQGLQPECPPVPQSGGQIPMQQPQHYAGKPPEHPSQFEESSVPPNNLSEPPPDYPIYSN